MGSGGRSALDDLSSNAAKGRPVAADRRHSTHVARAQEMQFFFRCVSLAYGKQMNGANTPMPLQWDDRSPAEVATQIVVKHGFAADTWSSRKVVAECLMREWEGAPEVLVV